MAITKIQSESLNLSDNYDFTGTVTGAGENNAPSFSAYISSNWSGTTNALSKCPFNTVKFDTASGFDTTNYKYTIPSGQGGKWLFSVMQRTQSNTNTSPGHKYTYLTLRKNGSEIRTSIIDPRPYYVEAINNPFTVVESCNAGDYLELYVLLDGTSLVWYGGSANTEFSGFKISS